jgi:hypothetical protein
MKTMKQWLLLVAALLVIGFVLQKFMKERFQPEFLDRTQIAKTIAVEDSSYDQRTNHMDPSPFSMGPISGMQTPFRVNAYTAYVQ